MIYAKLWLASSVYFNLGFHRNILLLQKNKLLDSLSGRAYFKNVHAANRLSGAHAPVLFIVPGAESSSCPLDGWS